jgi:hypothetical protein
MVMVECMTRVHENVRCMTDKENLRVLFLKP